MSQILAIVNPFTSKEAIGLLYALIELEIPAK